MASMGLGAQKQEILVALKKQDVETIVLVGEPGVGKTRMARDIRDSAISDGTCYATLWVSLNIKYDDRSFYESIARQLSLLSATDEWEDDDDNNVKHDEHTLDSLKQSILIKLDEQRSGSNKFLLLILDHEGKKTDTEWVLSKLQHLSKLNLKVIISRRNSSDGQITDNTGEAIKVEPKVINVTSLSEDDSLTLLKNRVNKRFSQVPNFEPLSRSIAQKTNNLPASIILTAEALNHSGKQDSVALEEAANELIPPLQFACDMLPPRVSDCFWHSIQFFSSYGGVHYNELISHWLIEGCLGPINHVEEAYEEGHQILMELINRGMLNIQEDNVVVMEGLLMDLVDRRHRGFMGAARVGLANVLKDDKWTGLGRITQTDGMIKTLHTGKKGEKISTVLIDGSRLSHEVPERFFQHMCELEVLALFDARLKFLPSSLANMKALLVLVVRGCDLLEDISCIRNLRTLAVLEISNTTALKKIPDNLFEKLSLLQSLNLSALNIKSLLPISNLRELRWLILRQCSCLEELPKLKEFTNLEVLDLCGASSLKRFQDKNFAPLQKLQTLDLSNTGIERLPIFHTENFPFLQDLKRLLLSGCDCLPRLPSLKPLSGLQILDLSGAVKLKEFSDESFEKNDALKILDLSETSINQLSFDNLNLCELKLRGCSRLELLPCTETLTDLELLDLSNASSLVRINDKSFEHLKLLRYLNLSNTNITDLPSLSNILNLRELLLRDCSRIEKLQNIEGLKRLEVLDLSGCRSLTVLQEISLKQMPRLHRLDLSRTKIKSLESLCNPGNLRHLVLRNCTNLKSLFPLESLSKLEVLDLSGSSSLTGIKAESLEHLTTLEILDLSEVKLVGNLSTSHFSKLINLTQLSLRGCLVEPELDMEVLMKLEVLDLSGTAVTTLLSLEKLEHIGKLLLRGCSSLERLPSLKSLTHLQVLDLSKTGIKELPDGISELACLDHLDLPDLKVLQGVGWEKIKLIPKELNCDQCSILEPVDILLGGRKKPSVQVNGTNFFQVLGENTKLGETCLKQMFLSVCSMNQSNYGNVYPLKGEQMNDIYFKLRHFSGCKEQGHAMEIRGFDEFPTGLKDVLEDVEYLSLVENMFMSHLSDLGIGNLKKLKGCWLEKCAELKSIISDGTDAKLVEVLEILWVSNLPQLQSICSEKVNLNNLQHLHIDCCPMLENVFPLPPVLENLKSLQIKFCDKLKTVFKCNESSKCSLQNLQTLRLFELPELTSVGAKLPSLVTFERKGCPKLEDTEESLKSRTASE